MQTQCSRLPFPSDSKAGSAYAHNGRQGCGRWPEILAIQKGAAHCTLLCKSDAREASIPCNPNGTYKLDGWQGYGHWLGTGNLAGGKLAFLPFKQALMHARTLNLKGFKEWRDWATTGARPANMPSTPDKIYKHDGWQGYGHWLGTGNVAPKDKQLLPFKKALMYARSLKLKSKEESRAWSKSGGREANMPSAPDITYKHDGWQGYGHWLDTGNIAGGKLAFIPFKKALVYARSLKLKSLNEWQGWAKTGVRPVNIPSNPNIAYKHDGWQGYGHWLGTGNVRNGDGQQFLTFDNALLYARSLKLESGKDWRIWCKSGARPINIPPNPYRTYTHDGWQGYRHWLGAL